MLHIAAGVCLGIVAAIYLLNWLASLAEWRAERRERRERAAWLLAYQASPTDTPGHGSDAFAAIFSLSILALAMAAFLALRGAYFAPIEPPAEPPTKWYLGHLDAELCVPLDNYGSGRLHTPEDIERWVRSEGETVQRTTHLNGHLINFVDLLVTDHAGKQIHVTVFSDRNECLSRAGKH